MTFTAGPGTKFLPYSGMVQPMTLGPLTLTGGTVTANTPVIDATQTWNSSGTTFTGIRFDVTDTASAAGSLLMDLRVGGVSRFSISKAGAATAASITFPTTGNDTGGTIAANDSFRSLAVTAATANSSVVFTNCGLELRSTIAPLLFGNASASTTPTLIYDGSSGVLAQRNSINAQTFRIYNTFTDASNYERVSFGWSTNIFTIGRESAGTGITRNIRIVGGNAVLGIGEAPSAAVSWTFSVNNILAGTDNAYDIGAAAASRPRNLFLGSYMQLSEMTAPAAPAANNVVIYAEDNGAGKTRLMARFATGAAQQIAIEP
jgi:hypothetical protein